ncbi:DUF4097 family beta strand repeat-containing protein [Halorubellus salinus]|uniref:DUF4097 family beta strand repeat-containing protein n=1 Tax=Halorubellus salinus TaxID=755309 RepID=UPI001D0622D2|nr:DUF4097 family beta strand repeat-containing protein [Halorubellus salinus]
MSPRAPHTSSSIDRRRFLAGTATIGAVALAGCISTSAGISNGSKSALYAVPEGRSLRVVAENGDVRVLADDSLDRVKVRSTVASNGLGNPLDSAPVETAIENDRYVIHARAERDGFLGGRVSHDVEVRVPAGVRVDRVETANGRVHVSGVAGDVHASSRNGDVAASSVDGVVSLESENGDVTASATRGVAEARTGNGDVLVDLVALDRDATLRSGNGDVTVRVDPALAARVDLSTDNGRVRVVDVAVDADVDERRHVRGRIGDGTHRITARTGNGDVRLEAY